MDFNLIVQNIKHTHNALQQSAAKAINIHLTIRNWLIGFYIVEFEQKGEDRAQYGEKLLERLSDSLQSGSFSYRNLRLFRQFYLTYPQIVQSVSAQLNQFGINIPTIWQSPIAKFNPKLQVPPEKLISQISFTHLASKEQFTQFIENETNRLS